VSAGPADDLGVTGPSSSGVSAGLLAVHAHPDDETLATGALLATWAAAGLPVTVVTATRGERGEVIGDDLAHLAGDGPALAAHRTRELAGALSALGVRTHTFLDARSTEVSGDGAPQGAQSPESSAGGYEDSGMVWADGRRAALGDDVPVRAFVRARVDEAAARLADVLRERRPSVVVTYDEDGGYGHPDHVRVHEVTIRALEMVRGEGIEPTLLVRRAAAGDLRAAYRALARDEVAAALGVDPAALKPIDPDGPLPGLGAEPAGLRLPDPDGPLPALVVPDDVAASLLTVPVGPVRARVLAALRAHATQVQAVREIDGVPGLVGCYALSAGLLEPVLPEEAYQHVSGPAPAALVPARPVA
jgi:N-acetyl-1-D-myo-inositol-2-amino-2-deoxy-alpha-D-glucopyranoside deacetylase